MSERQDHIILSSNGRTYDLTALETPPSMLPEDVFRALENWPHGREWWCHEMNCWNGGSAPLRDAVHRAKPAPEVKEYVLYWSAGRVGLKEQTYSDTHRITICDDGTGKLDITGEKLK